MTDDDPEASGEGADNHSAGDPFVWDDGDGGAETGDDAVGAGTADAGMGDDGAHQEPDSGGRDAGRDDAPLGGLADEIRQRKSGEAAGEGSGGRPGRSAGAGDAAADSPAGGDGSGSPADDGEPASPADGSEPPSPAGGAEPTAGEAGEPTAGSSADRSGAAGGNDAPLGGLADEVRRRRSGGEAGDGAGGATTGDSDETDEEFTEMGYQEIESDQLWERLDDDAGGVAPAEPADADGTVDAGDVRVIPKRTCETCPHFTRPPEVGCTHEGTRILELVGVDRHKVVDCPMVVDDAMYDDSD